jgi:hypothetical protein
MTNAVRWAAPVQVVGFRDLRTAPQHPQPLEDVVIED